MEMAADDWCDVEKLLKRMRELQEDHVATLRAEPPSELRTKRTTEAEAVFAIYDLCDELLEAVRDAEKECARMKADRDRALEWAGEWKQRALAAEAER